MKSFILVTVLAATCFVPAAVIGWVNRPVAQAIPVSPTVMTWPVETAPQVQNIIQLNPIKIYSDIRYHKKAEREKEYVCRDRELLSGGMVRHCDWL